MTPAKPCSCRFCGESFSAQGIREHERTCDDNPRPGVPPEQLRELGELEEPDVDDAGDDVDDVDDELPPVETLEPAPEPDDVGPECPLCGSSDVLDADAAREAYAAAVDGQPNERALKAYAIAEWACQKAECAALWGGEFPEPAPMSAVIA